MRRGRGRGGEGGYRVRRGEGGVILRKKASRDVYSVQLGFIGCKRCLWLIPLKDTTEIIIVFHAVTSVEVDETLLSSTVKF